MLVFVLIALSPVAAKEFAPEGGSGGGFFRDLCPAGQYLVGTNAHTGNVVDQISITCASVNPDGSTGTQYHGPNRGGPGGSTPRLTTCGDHEIISAMGLLPGDVPPHTVIRLIIFNCVSTTGTARHNLDIGNAPIFPTIQQSCAEGEAATGIQGQSGTYVDALGLICGPFTRPSSGTGPSAAGCSGLAGEELDICDEHNVERAKHGVPPLNWSADLAKNAQDWVKGCHTSKNSNGDEFFCHQSKDYGCGNRYRPITTAKTCLLVIQREPGSRQSTNGIARLMSMISTILLFEVERRLATFATTTPIRSPGISPRLFGGIEQIRLCTEPLLARRQFRHALGLRI